MNRLVCRLIDAWHNPTGLLGLQTERHQGSPVNYHQRQRETAAALAQREAAERKNRRMEASFRNTPPSVIRTLDQSPAQKIPESQDPPYWDEGTLLEQCCETGVVVRDGKTYLCPGCNGMLFKEHGHA